MKIRGDLLLVFFFSSHKLVYNCVSVLQKFFYNHETEVLALSLRNSKNTLSMITKKKLNR